MIDIITISPSGNQYQLATDTKVLFTGTRSQCLAERKRIGTAKTIYLLKENIMEQPKKQQTGTCFVIGHTPTNGGLFSKFLGNNEYKYHKEIIKPLLEAKGFKVFTHTISGYFSRQKAMARKTAAYKNVIELHFNGSEDPSANGCEVLHWFSNKKTEAKAQEICKELNEQMGIKIRRNKGAFAVVSKGTNGGQFLVLSKGNALLLEPFFGSSPKDCDKFDAVKYVDILDKAFAD